MTTTRKHVCINLLAIAGLLLVLGFAAAALTTAAGASFYRAANPWARIAREQARGERLEARLRETTRRMAARDQVIAALCAGRLTLLEAAARFRDLDAECPDPRRDILTLVMRKFDPTGNGLSYDECVCRTVIDYVRRGREGQDPEHSCAGTAEAAPRLEEEYRQLVRAGALHLPE